jgi:GMP synthase-like glutamine amidotransferase
MDPQGFEIFAVWKRPIFPEDDFHSYIITGDHNNISDGLLPFHVLEIDFLKGIQGKRMFASCFGHQLYADAFGGKSGRRERRFLGWRRLDILEEHPIFKGIQEANFLCLNGDEVMKRPEGVRLLASNPKCRFQVLQYGENVITCQSHPEIFRDEGQALILERRKVLQDRCPDLHDILEKTIAWADDAVNEIFLRNLTSWLYEDY